MRTFGSYEAVEELSRNAFGVVYSARPPASKQPPSHLVKVFTPPDVSGSGRRADSQTENFLAAARLQQKAAQASKHWAPIHEIGTCPEGAYYISSLYPMSARRLVMGKVKLADADLHALLSAIVAGLIDLRGSCSQAHGNIKLTTVLLPRGGETAYKAAVLAEPLLPHKAAAVTEATDLAAIARLVHHLVTLRPLSDAGGWPIPAGAEWSRLGRSGDAWRELCNRLLDPNPGAAMTLDSLVADLDKLKPRRPLVSGRFAAAAAVLLVLAGIGYGLYVHYAPYFRYSREDWTTLADAYARWLIALDKYDEYPDLKVAVLRDPELSAIVQEMKKSGILFDTQQILGTREFGYAGARDHFPATAEGERRTRLAVEYMPKVAEGLEKWSAPQAARAVRDRLRSVNSNLADSLTDLLEQASTRSAEHTEFASAVAKLSGLSTQLSAMEKDLQAIAALQQSLSSQKLADRPVFPDLAQQVMAAYGGSRPVAMFGDFARSLTEVKGALESLDRDWKELGPLLQTSYDAGDSILRRVPEFLAESLHEGGANVTLPLLAERLQKLRTAFTGPPWSQLPVHAAAWKSGTIDKVEFQKHEPYMAGLPAEPRLQLAAWAAEAGKYLTLPPADDPRAGLAAKTARLNDALRVLDEDYPPSSPTPEQEVVQLREQAAAWKRTVSELTSPSLKWLAGWQHEIITGSARAETDLEMLLKRIEEARFVRPEAREAFIASVAAAAAQFRHPVLQQRWQSLAAQWLKDQEAWRKDNRSLRPSFFHRLQRDVKLAKDHLAAIESALPSGMEVDSPAKAPAWNGALVAELARLAARERDTAIAAAIQMTDWSDVPGRDFTRQWEAAKGAHFAWRNQAAMVVADLRLIEALLDGGYGLASPITDKYAQIRQWPQWRDVAETVQTLTSRISALEAPGSARADLLKAANSRDASLAVAAWRGLDSTWPATLEELDVELSIQHHLAGLLTLSSEPGAEKYLAPFREALASERLARSRSAWRRLAEATADRDAAQQGLDALMARMDKCGIVFPPDPQLSLSPATRFNIALYRLRQLRKDAEPLEPRERDSLAKARFERFRTEIPSESKNLKEVVDLLSRLEQAAQPISDPRLLHAQDGPPASRVQGITWAVETDKDLRTFRWQTRSGQTHALVFRKLEMEPDVAREPVYLCTTEVSLGLFIDVVNALASQKQAFDRGALVGMKQDPFWRAPQVWFLANGTLLPASRWHPFIESAFAERVHAPDLANVVEAQLRGDQARQLPIQRIGPATVMYLAHLLGCRLPTSREFDAAKTMQAAGRPDTPPNLRDITWKRQQDYLLGIVSQEGDAAKLQAPWPDSRSFGFNAAAKTGPGAEVPENAIDDKHLWFRDVQTDELFCNLIGNVAEYTWEDVTLLPDGPQQRDINEFKAIVARHAKGNLHVIGASAISAPELGAGRHTVVDFADGFSDVGFRLAFTVPSRTIVDRIRIVADNQKYLVAAPAGSTGGNQGRI